MMKRCPRERKHHSFQKRSVATVFEKVNQEKLQQQQKQLLSPPPEQPVYLKPSRSGRRKPSFVFTRMRDEPPGYAFKAPSLGRALPLFCITSPSCEYYALRLPLVKAGFKRLPAHANLGIPSNVIWGRSMSLHHAVNTSSSFSSVRLSQDGGVNTDSLGVAAQSVSEKAREVYLGSLKMTCTHQRFNHFPHSHSNIGCKWGLTSRLRRMAESLNAAGVKQCLYNFVPRTWIYPEEKEVLMKAMAEASPQQRFIWKPARGSCGRGIFTCMGGVKNAPQWEWVTEAIENHAMDGVQHMVAGRKYVVQEYIEDPLLLDGRKMDLRLYVAVTSYDPLVVYLHTEGLVRLAAQEYDTGTNRNCSVLKFDPFRDLTNYSVGRKWHTRNRQQQQSAQEKDDLHIGSAATVSNNVDLQSPPLELKKSLAELWDYIDRMYPLSMHTIPSVTFANAPLQQRMSCRVWNDISRVIVKTLFAVKDSLASAVSSLPYPGEFFELYGFDMMLDAKLKPWLVEVNTLPSLASTSPLDYAVKTNVVADLLNLALIEPFERPMTSFEDLKNGDGLLPHTGIFDSLSPEAKDSVHHWNGHSGRDFPHIDDKEAKEELFLRLLDESTYSRGFQRIFPPLPAERTSTLMDEVTILGPHIPLSKYDMWTLEA